MKPTTRLVLAVLLLVASSATVFAEGGGLPPVSPDKPPRVIQQ
jgi:hypothetical protein